MTTVEQVLQYRLFTIAGTPVDVATVTVALITAIITFFIARLAERATGAFLKRRGLKEEGSIAASGRLVTSPAPAFTRRRTGCSG